jgi:hypothetical protein
MTTLSWLFTLTSPSVYPAISSSKEMTLALTLTLPLSPYVVYLSNLRAPCHQLTTG